MLEVAVLYGCDLSQVFTPIILRLYQPHSLCEKAALYVFLLAPLREGRPGSEIPQCQGTAISTRAPTRGATAIFTKPQVDLYDKLLKIHIFKLTLSVYSSIHLKTLKITLLGLHEPPGKMCTGRVGVRK